MVIFNSRYTELTGHDLYTTSNLSISLSRPRSSSTLCRSFVIVMYQNKDWWIFLKILENVRHVIDWLPCIWGPPVWEIQGPLLAICA